ncbi:hypothetical protein V5R04_01540 [Jonesiaceae bacterium BS-20]|uniref:Uncharacterized protein n=1 Tax=Jonesiaceae bacterium BS-20 TaxID=3120821 RepID=A0AAU7DUT1_9MICO
MSRNITSATAGLGAAFATGGVVVFSAVTTTGRFLIPVVSLVLFALAGFLLHPRLTHK